MTTGEQGLPRASLLSTFGLVVGNLVPLWAVWAGHMSVGDVLIAYWLENVVYWALTIVKISTAQGLAADGRQPTIRVNGRVVDASRNRGMLAGFFALHYGIFTLVHGVFAGVMAVLVGGDLSVRTAALAGLALVLGHVVSLWLNWFGDGERLRVSPTTAMWEPYPRMLVLHVTILVGFGLAIRSVGTSDSTSGLVHLAPVLLLVGLKTVVDLGLHVWSRRRAAPDATAPSPATW
ncbi:DUF6498-containing protein [Nocardioides hwasunensis]|uniref:Uncharacterized protein n=1 Tax=Nocardioides hwasunensis TaxID=397258 RepID=A0ABR8MDX2_9ACTN|nr:DUF6498-containing protein [Nocardioides hwasunensis]MBD3914162.1 hypothetical protein [Nocardioides hwasunensis]